MENTELAFFRFVIEQTFRNLYLQLTSVPSNSTTHVGLEEGSGCVLFPRGDHPFPTLVVLRINATVARFEHYFQFSTLFLVPFSRAITLVTILCSMATCKCAVVSDFAFIAAQNHYPQKMKSYQGLVHEIFSVGMISFSCQTAQIEQITFSQ